MFQSTVIDDLRDPEAFCRAYSGAIRAALGGVFGLRDDEADDLAQAFLLKLLPMDLVRRREALDGPFRGWLFAALRNFVRDHLRRERRWRTREPLDDQDEAGPDEPGPGDKSTGPDTLYALCVLHLALQAMRRHCESAGRPEIWSVFRECALDATLAGRRPRPNEEIARDFPGWDRQTVSNRLETARRIFRRVLPEVIPPAMSDRPDPGARFEEWFEILRTSHAGRDDLLHLAFRVTPAPPPGGSAINSMHLAESSTAERLTDDELRILLDFRLALPLESYLGRVDAFYEGKRAQSPPTLLSLVEPGQRERPSDLLGLLKALKAAAKSTHEDRGHGVPAEITKVVYNLAVALALVECDARITSLSDDQVRKNARRTLSYPWLDARVRGPFEATLARLGGR